MKYSGRQKVPTTTIGGRAHSACTQCEGELGESMWRKLEDEKLADRATIAHNLHLATLARDGEKAAALGKRHKTHGIDSGIDSAVEAFVRRTVKETVINEDGTTEVKAIERVNKQHLVQALLMPSRPQRQARRACPTRRSSHCAAQGQPRPDSLRGDDDAR